MHFPLCVGSMSVDSWIHWHPSSLLFTCYPGVPPLAESFCSDNVIPLNLQSWVRHGSSEASSEPRAQPAMPGGVEMKEDRKNSKKDV